MNVNGIDPRPSGNHEFPTSLSSQVDIWNFSFASRTQQTCFSTVMFIPTTTYSSTLSFDQAPSFFGSDSVSFSRFSSVLSFWQHFISSPTSEQSSSISKLFPPSDDGPRLNLPLQDSNKALSLTWRLVASLKIPFPSRAYFHRENDE